jgi:hypothetical protein
MEGLPGFHCALVERNNLQMRGASSELRDGGAVSRRGLVGVGAIPLFAKDKKDDVNGVGAQIAHAAFGAPPGGRRRE